MIPLFLKLQIPRKDQRPVNLYLPLFLVWLLLLPFVILLAPLVLLMAALTWSAGFGRFLLLLLPMTAALIWNLQGLMVDIKDGNDKIYLFFI